MPTRILYVSDALAITGGLERVLIEKANRLSRLTGYEVFVLTVNQGNHPLVFPLSDAVVYNDLHVQFYLKYQHSGVRKFLMDLRLHRLFHTRLSDQVNKITPDVIVCARVDFLYDILKVKGQIPLVFESHSSRFSWRFDGSGYFRRFHVWKMQLAVRKVQMVVALTHEDATEWRKLNPQVCVIPNIVQLNDTGTYSDCRSNHAIFVGRFTHQKDIDALLRVWKAVNQKHPDWHLDMYGDGELKAYYQERIEQLDINIHVHHPESDIFLRYKESSMLLLTSLYEPFGLVLPEAMSCGLPVVAFDCPYGPADIITDGVDGFLVKERDVETFAQRVDQLISSYDLRRQMGQAGIRSSQRYQASRIMPQWIQLFERICQSERGR